MSGKWQTFHLYIKLWYLKWKGVDRDRTLHLLSLNWTAELNLIGQLVSNCALIGLVNFKQMNFKSSTNRQTYFISPCWTATFAVKKHTIKILNKNCLCLFLPRQQSQIRKLSIFFTVCAVQCWRPVARHSHGSDSGSDSGSSSDCLISSDPCRSVTFGPIVKFCLKDQRF